jgi:hypothetical protein
MQSRRNNVTTGSLLGNPSVCAISMTIPLRCRSAETSLLVITKTRYSPSDLDRARTLDGTIGQRFDMLAVHSLWAYETGIVDIWRDRLQSDGL